MTHEISRALSADITRCHDRCCPLRQQCLRWLDRHVPGATPHSASLRERGEESCAHQIEP